MLSLSVILPVHNEENGIELVVTELCHLLNKNKITYEVICVENGSTDNSYKILKKLEKKYKKITVVRWAKGWGNAVRKGLSLAKGEYICFSVSDNQVKTENIIKVYRKILTTGHAMVKIRRVSRENFSRFLNSLLFNLVAQIFFDLKSLDINGTPKILKSSLLKSLHLQSTNIALDLELLVKLKKMNLSWLEIPVKSNKRKAGASTTNLNSVFEMLYYMVKFLKSQ